MTVEIALVLGLVMLTLALFASQRLPLDIAALAILVVVMAIPIVGDIGWVRERGVDLPAAFPTVSEGLSGLSNPATVTVLAMFILSAGVQRSGLMHAVGNRMLPFVGNSEFRLFFLTAGMVGLLSGVVNNTAAVAVAIPFVIEMCRAVGIRAARILMPLSFFGMLGGMLTLIGTSTNLLASTILADTPEFGRNLGMFEFTHVGLIVLVTGLVYFLLIGRFLLPDGIDEPETEQTEQFVVEIAMRPDSSWLGDSLADSGKASATGMEIVRLVRANQGYVTDAETMPLKDGDVLQVRGTTRQISDLIASDDVDVLGGTDDLGPATGEQTLVRALLRNRLVFTGQRARNIEFWRRYRARLVGIEAAATRASRLADEKLRVGEILLLEVGERPLERLRKHPDVVLISEFTDEFDKRRMWIAGGIVLAVVVGAAATPLPIVLTAIAGIIAMAATGCVTKDDIYGGVAWDVIFLLAGVIPLGIAMTKSGGAAWLGNLMAHGVDGWHPLLVLMVLYAFTTVLTEIVSNNAAVVILVPIAVSVSDPLGISVLALVLTVMFAASTSFLSPVGYQTNAMVFGTGLYKFTDFAKVGGPLNLILMVVTSMSIWHFWVR